MRTILGAREHKSLHLGAYSHAAQARPRKTTRLDAWQAKVFGALRNAVAAMTGYEIESISLEDRFQEDLAIDSLKGSRPEPPSDKQIRRCRVVWEEAPLAAAGGRTAAESRIIPLRAMLDRDWRWSDDPCCTELVLVASPQDFASRPEDAGPGRDDVERLLTLFQAFQSLVPRLREHDFRLVLATSDDSHAGIGVRGRTSLIHFRCRVHDQLALHAPAPAEVTAGRVLEAGQLYREGSLFHGPTFQVLDQVLVGEAGRLEGRIDSARLRAVYGMEPWDRLTQWVDGAF